MSRAVFLAFLIAAVVCIHALPRGNVISTRCGPNEVFDTCGTACPPTCRDPNPTVCVLRCVMGCHCKTGFVRNEQGQCVLTQNC